MLEGCTRQINRRKGGQEKPQESETNNHQCLLTELLIWAVGMNESGYVGEVSATLRLR